MQSLLKKKMAAKQGIALIVVLALLAMLVIMAVSFVIFMRTERTASRDYAEMVKARNIAQTGITRALVRMQQDMNLSNQFYHGGGFYMTGAGEICSNWMTADFNFLDHYVPAQYNSIMSQARSTSCKWTNLVVKGISGNNMLVGRYSYVVLDCSDFVDINTMSNVAVRGNGNYPGEVAMPPADVAVASGGANLVAERNRHPFESLCEVNLRNRSNNFFHNPADQYQPYHLVTFSYVPVDSYWANNKQNARVVISTNAAQIKAQMAGIKNVATSLGLDTSFYDNLYDFANSTTDIPSNPNEMGGGKLVPMLYELIVTNGLHQVTVAGKKMWELQTRFLVETWFPFPVTANKTYTVKLSTKPTFVFATTPVTAFPWTLVPASSYPTVTPVPIQTTRTNSFWTNAFVFIYRNADTNLLSSVKTTITFQGNITVNGSAVVDQMPIPATAASIIFDATPSKAVVSKGWGANDPRINWRTSDWVANKAADPVKSNLGRTNDLCNVKTDIYGDGSTFMYAQHPTNANLKSIGDLGYLLYDASKPWHTVRMMGPDAADPKRTRQLFNMLSIIPTNKVYQGFVNPNSKDAGALLCAFLGASKERYPGETTAPRMTQAEANNLANRLIALGINSGKANAYTNIADVLRLQDTDIAAGVDFWQKKASCATASAC